MTYLEKLLELNRCALEQANAFFEAKTVHEKTSATFPGEEVRMLKRMSTLFRNYRAALDRSNQLVSIMTSNKIKLDTRYIC